MVYEKMYDFFSISKDMVSNAHKDIFSVQSATFISESEKNIRRDLER